MLKEMSITELREWRAYADLEPFDEGRADLRAASIAYFLVSAWRGRKGRKLKLQDFLLKFGDELEKATAPKQQSWQNMKLLSQMIVAANAPPPPKRRRKRG
jgi:hypothetical protein